MATGLTADDVLLLSAWAAGGDEGTSGSEGVTTESSGSSSIDGESPTDLQLLFGAVGGDDHELSAADAPRRTRKKRRATYLRTREEREGLQSEIAALESRLTVLKKRAGITSDESIGKAVNNAVLRGMVQQQQMAFANVQSMMSKSVNVQELHPLYTPVHLGMEWPERRRIMSSLKIAKLRTALQYLTERSCHHDELLPYASQEVSQDSEGNIVCTQFEMIQFSGVRSLREVYDATYFFFLNEEMVLSDRLGHLAIRDDYGVVDGAAANSRMYWIDQNNIMTEWNAVHFAQLFEGDTSIGGQECAVLVSDNVDTDALYPYQSANRVRRDLSGAIMLTVAKTSSSKEDEGLVVTLRRAAVTKLHRPHFPMSQSAREALIKGVFSWSQAMTDTIRSRLSLSKSTARVNEPAKV